MKIFGNKEIFAIEYELCPNPFKEKGIIGDSWGKLRVWIVGKELCAREVLNEIKDYEWNLLCVSEWLYNNLELILTDIEFPVEAKGTNSLELIKCASKFDSDDEEMFDLWFEKLQNWCFNHSWFSSRSGSFLPDVYFRRVACDIEIAWDNMNTYQENECYFMTPQGVEYVNRDIFNQVVTEYLKDFADALNFKFIVKK